MPPLITGSAADPTYTSSLQELLWGRHTILRPANRGFTLAEQQLRFGWSRDDELQYWSGSLPSGRTFAEFQRMLPERDWPSDGRRRSYAILDRSLQLIGMVSCYAIDWKDRTGELGVYIGDRTHWGHGLGTDAVITLLGHLFADLNLNRISLNTYATNVRALRSYGKAGFVREGTRRRFRPSVGHYREVRMMIDRAHYFRNHSAEDRPRPAQLATSLPPREA